MPSGFVAASPGGRNGMGWPFHQTPMRLCRQGKRVGACKIKERQLTSGWCASMEGNNQGCRRRISHSYSSDRRGDPRAIEPSIDFLSFSESSLMPNLFIYSEGISRPWESPSLTLSLFDPLSYSTTSNGNPLIRPSCPLSQNFGAPLVGFTLVPPDPRNTSASPPINPDGNLQAIPIHQANQFVGNPWMQGIAPTHGYVQPMDFGNYRAGGQVRLWFTLTHSRLIYARFSRLP